MKRPTTPLPDDPLWYKDAIIYELRVRAFYDSDGDGIGDFRGLTEKLDYLQELGVTALWLLPFYPSPLRDDGYDISDYTDVHPDCGNLNDFKRFMREAHRRGLRVITELVLNHTSDQHAWFQRARQAKPNSRYRDFYVWNDSPDKFQDARVIFKDFEPSNWTYDTVAKSYSWHRFFHHQPDLNFDHPPVRRAMRQVLDFWLEMGVDGLRLDAVPYLFEREGTNCENLPETHEYLRELRGHLDKTFRNRMFLAEANQWPEDAVAYFGDGDECHVAFHFPIMPRMFMAIQMEDRYPIIDILEDTPPIPDICQWALFLRNHDELTLEMVTDEERDYMYRMYAHELAARINLGIRRRLAPLLGNNRRKIELMNGLLFSLPGTPVIYYGDEIGMGDNIYLGDRNGVRTPMQWSADRNAGFSNANPQLLYLPVTMDPEYHYEAINVETLRGNAHSLLWWMRRLIALRKQYLAFGRGTLTLLTPSNSKVLAFMRQYGEERILVVANLSRFVQFVELDLSEWRGMTPMELFGKNPFPSIGELPYLLTLAPHGFYWFALERPEVEVSHLADGDRPLPALESAAPWSHLVHRDRTRASLEKLLPAWLKRQRWFGGKARTVREARLLHPISMPVEGEAIELAQVQVDYSDGMPETYLVPLAWSDGEEAERVRREAPHAAVATLTVRGPDTARTGLLYDALADTRFAGALLDVLRRRRQVRGDGMVLAGVPLKGVKEAEAPDGGGWSPRLLSFEQSNTNVVFGDRFIMKVFRRVEHGINPDRELGRYLVERKRFPHTPAVAGYLEFRHGRGAGTDVAILHDLVANQGDAWQFTLDDLQRFFERVVTGEQGPAEPPEPPSLFAGEPAADGGETSEVIGSYQESARLLGERTAGMHVALSGEGRDRAFTPEPFSTLYQRSLFQAFRTQTSLVFDFLRSKLRTLPRAIQGEAAALVEREAELMARFRSIVGGRIDAMRIRTHGDYHLGQVLYTGRDFVIIDFEGEPARAISERSIKRSPLRDVAGMLRSFDYAAFSALEHWLEMHPTDQAGAELLGRWARYWVEWNSAAFVGEYRRAAAPGRFLPASLEDSARLLNNYMMEKALYELGYELNNRPAWAHIPLRGLRHLLDSPLSAKA